MNPWILVKYALDRNNSPAWNKINQIVGLANMADKDKKTSAKTTYNGAVDNSGMYGTYGG